MNNAQPYESLKRIRDNASAQIASLEREEIEIKGKLSALYDLRGQLANAVDAAEKLHAATTKRTTPSA